MPPRGAWLRQEAGRTPAVQCNARLRAGPAPASFPVHPPLPAAARCSACPALACSIQPEGAHKQADLLDADGLPHVGAPIWPGQSYYCAVDKLTGGWACAGGTVGWVGAVLVGGRSARARAAAMARAAGATSATQPAALSAAPAPPAGKAKGGKLKGEETAVVDQVAVVGAGKDRALKQATIKLRFNRNPVIGAPAAALRCADC